MEVKNLNYYPVFAWILSHRCYHRFCCALKVRCFFLWSQWRPELPLRCSVVKDSLLKTPEPPLNWRLQQMTGLQLWALKLMGALPCISLVSQHRALRVALPGDDPFPNVSSSSNEQWRGGLRPQELRAVGRCLVSSFSSAGCKHKLDVSCTLGWMWPLWLPLFGTCWLSGAAGLYQDTVQP